MVEWPQVLLCFNLNAWCVVLEVNGTLPQCWYSTLQQLYVYPFLFVHITTHDKFIYLHLCIDVNFRSSAGVLTNRNPDFYLLTFWVVSPDPSRILPTPARSVFSIPKHIFKTSEASEPLLRVKLYPYTPVLHRFFKNPFVLLVLLRNNVFEFSRYNQRVLLLERADEQMHSDRGIWDSSAFVWNITDLIGSDTAIIQHGEPLLPHTHTLSLTHTQTIWACKVQLIFSHFHQYIFRLIRGAKSHHL